MTNERKITTYLYYAAFLFLCVALVPWAMKFLTYAMNVDIAFLTVSAERMLAGETMSEAYYDTNPPLSIIVQIPAVLLAKITGIPLYYATSLYVFILLGLSLIATNALLKKIDGLSTPQRVIILSVFLFLNTVKPGYDFGQKDHILGMALFPLVLTQILITTRIDFSKLLMWCTLLAGSLLILLKPHYGLIPAAIFLHRIIYQKRISVFKDVDFITLAGMAIGYIAALFLLFSDFINIILPDILKYYTTDISPSVMKIGVILIIQAAIPLFLCQMFLKKAHFLISVFSVMAVLCLIPFIMQGKGWAYHAIPATFFLYSCVALLLHHLIVVGLSMIKMDDIKKPAAFIVVMIAVFGLVYKKTQAMHDFPTHEQYLNSELTQIINDNCTKPCSFFFFNDMINIAPELAVYTGQRRASRFPVMWFMPDLIYAQDMLDKGTPLEHMGEEELNKAKNKYITMVLEDLEKHDPSVMIIGHYDYRNDKDNLFDFKEFTLQSDPKFNEFWNQYTLQKTIDIDRIEYMIAKLPGENLIQYDIYVKNAE